MTENYPQYCKELKGLIAKMGGALPGTVSGFMKMHGAALADGALDGKTKELLCLGMAIATHCEGCIAFHTSDALGKGATREEIMETIGVAVLMGGGPALMYGCEALKALEQFETQNK